MYIALFSIYLLLYISSGKCNEPIISSNGVTIRGVSMETFGGRKIAAYLGLPYAKPTVAEKRFETAEEIGQLSGEYDGRKESEDCLQYSQATYKVSSGVYGVEDCLYANVYTPKVGSNETMDKLLDVLVYIHGGVFMFTYAHYGPKYLLDQDIILVTFNYRLGPLGFLSTEDEVIPGNNGLKDQSLLLRWVKKNIRLFGGNPDSVTIAGTSAGSSSVHYHMISPLSKGLFHRSFSMSGTVLIPWAQAENSLEKAKKLAEIFNCSAGNSLEIKQCLKQVDGEKLVKASTEFMPWLYLPLAPFGPVVEARHDGAFISRPPVDIIKSGSINEVPWLVTMTSSEGLYPAADIAGDPKLMNELEQNWNRLLPLLLDYNSTIDKEKLNDVSERIKQEYFYGEHAGSDVTNMLKMASDRLFVEGIVNAANLHMKYCKSPVYSYYFSYRGKSSISDAISNTKIDFGASHGDDTSYVLQNKYMNPEQTKSDIKMIKLLTKVWTSFASTGKPEIDGISDWPLISNQSGSGLTLVHISSPQTVRIEVKENLGNGKFWNSLGFAENLSTQ
ncbi:hypothetical protein O3M35_007905 [Rhynocoris fuscipes]|uniref:Carboxylic ester hydrolase n=1 Tax=Rhynocoris fuscipes TaxID=488301 RepID=A0AAW1DIA0_9HEMI